MTEQRFFECDCGRLTAGLTALALLGAAALAIAPAGPLSRVLGAIGALVLVAGFIVATGLATQHFGLHAVGMMLALPVLGGLYFAALAVVAARGLPVAAPLGGLALLAAWLALRSPEQRA